MTRGLGHLRALLATPISRGQLALVSAASVIATAVILAGSQGRTPIQDLAMAALRHRGYVVHHVGSASASPVDSTASSPAVSNAAGGSSAGGGGTASSSDSSAASADTGSITSLIGASSTTPATPSTPTKPTAGHVFVIALSTTSFEASFGPSSAARYLNHRLRPQGIFLGGYESLGATELPDLLAMISGQPPNPDTEAGCTTYADFDSGAKPAADGTTPGTGCVYPNTALTVADQVTAAGQQWRAYIDGIGSMPCPHPNSGAADSSEPPGAGPLYDTRHNPFIYFHSLLDLGGCASDDVSIARLSGDLGHESRTPAYSFLSPGRCADATATSCPDGAVVGLAAEDAFLRRWVPKILRSPAYRKDGVLIIAFALAPASGSAPAGGAGGSAPTGALILSPRASRGQTVSTSYDAYSLLRTTEDLLGYKPLAKAAQAKSFAHLVSRG